MAIRYRDIELLAPVLEKLDPLRTRRLLTLGVQDCNFSYAEITKFLSWKGYQFQPVQTPDILPTTGYKWRSGRAKPNGEIHQRTLFSLLGFEGANVQALDLSDYEGADFVHDMNAPIPPTLEEAFDLVFDGGLIEHVFSLKDALFNAARLVKVGGIVAHHSPFDWPEHGFVNINPKLYRTFYSANGFKEIDCRLVAESEASQKDYFIIQNPNFRFSLRPQFRSSIFLAFQKERTVELRSPLEMPYQELTGRQFSF